MDRILDTWRKLDGGIAAVEKAILVLAVFAMVGAIFAQSILRFFFDFNLYGASSWATVLLVWVGFISASVATRDKKHIVVDIIPKLLGDRSVVLAINAAVSLATAGFLVYAAWAAWSYLQSPGVQFRSMIGVQLPWSETPLPTKYVVAIMPAAIGMTALRFFQISCEEFAIWLGYYPADKRRTPPSIEDMVAELRASQKETP